MSLKLRQVHHHSTKPSHERRKRVLVENPKKDKGKFRKITFSQPARTAHPNGAVLWNGSAQASPSYTTFTLLSPPYFPITAGEVSLWYNKLTVKPDMPSERLELPSKNQNSHSEQIMSSFYNMELAWNPYCLCVSTVYITVEICH